MCTGEEMDWREMRAKLVAQERQQSAGDGAPVAEGGEGYVYESPLIEQGTILLGGTKQEFGFALRQQFFHKCVLLLLEHGPFFTKGIILNRPTALELDGWRVWCGHGQVAEGGMFLGSRDDVMGELEINALHSLDDPMATRLSTPVIKGVSYTDFDGAKALVEAGVAKREDFYVCVGYSGWAPGQLQTEVEKRDSWYLAAADSGTLLRELLKQGRELPPLESGEVPADHGVAQWASLMRGIGRDDDVRDSDGDLADRMLGAWVRARLRPRPLPPTPRTPPPVVGAGTVLCTAAGAGGGVADRVLLADQFLHKSLLVVLGELPGGEGGGAAGAGAGAGDGETETGKEGVVVACVLNRATDTKVRFNLPGEPIRRFNVCGNKQLGAALATDGSGQLWLHHRAELGGTALGESGLYRLSGAEAAAKLQAGDAAASDFLLAGSSVHYGRAELAAALAAAQMRVVPAGERLRALWPRVWSLADADADGDGGSGEDDGELRDGTDVWWLASQLAVAAEAPQGAVELEAVEPQVLAATAPTTELADEALSEWISFFARDRAS